MYETSHSEPSKQCQPRETVPRAKPRQLLCAFSLDLHKCLRVMATLLAASTSLAETAGDVTGPAECAAAAAPICLACIAVAFSLGRKQEALVRQSLDQDEK
jgi:hypothetical protein